MKNYIFLFLIIVSSFIATADSELITVCGGDDELIIHCLGDQELNSIHTLSPVLADSDGGKAKFYTTEIFIYSVFIIIFLIAVLFLYLIYRKR